MVINPDRLEEVAMGDREFLMELIDLYIEDAPSQLAALESAVSNEDATAACSAAHKLKGSCGNVGADGLVALCHRLEASGRANQVQELAAIFEQIVREFGQVNIALQAVKAGTSPVPDNA